VWSVGQKAPHAFFPYLYVSVTLHIFFASNNMKSICELLSRHEYMLQSWKLAKFLKQKITMELTFSISNILGFY